MKVLLISHTCQSRSEGQPKAVELGRLGVDLTVVVPRRWKHYGRWRAPQMPASDAGFRFLPMRVGLPWSGPAQSYLHFYPGLGRLLRDWQPDVIDLWEEPWSLVSLQTARLRDRFCPDAVLVSETEQNVEKRLLPPFENFRSAVLARADWVVGRSAEAIEIVRRKGYSGPASVVPNAVDAAAFVPLSPAQRQQERHRRGWAEGEFVAGYIGRLVEEKGLDDLLDALPHARPNVRAVLVGNGPHQGALEARRDGLNLGARVEFLAAMERPELARLMGALDVLVLPSRTTARWKEQFGRVLIEASACAIPVVGSSSGAIPDVVGQAGLVFAETNPRDLADKLDWLATHPTEAQQMGKRGRQSVEEHYTWARVAQAMERIYREATAA